jgi:hypothetical protein
MLAFEKDAQKLQIFGDSMVVIKWMREAIHIRKLLVKAYK